MIPPLDPTSGHLPPGRYQTNLDEVQARFVEHPEAGPSDRRVELWTSFERYLMEWARVEDAMAAPGIIQAIWMGGSFISAKADPGDIDISPIIDAAKLESISGQPGSKQVKALIGHRKDLQADYQLDVFPIPWRAATSGLFNPSSDHPQRDYLLRRGSLDDWWQRVSPHGASKGPPTEESAVPRRGYLEVVV